MNKLHTGAHRTLQGRIKRVFRPKLARAASPYDWVVDAQNVTKRLVQAGFTDSTGKMLPQWVKDQMQSDACGGFAGSYGLGIINAVIKGVAYVALSAKSIYSLIFFYGGGTTDVALQNQLKKGAMTEAQVPSLNANGQCTEAFVEDKSWYVAPDNILMSQYAEPILVNVENNVEAIAEAVRDYGVVFIHLNSDFTQVQNWLSANPQRTQTSPDGHFLCIYNTQILEAVKSAFLAESWGLQAGDKGTQYISENTFIGSPDIVDLFTIAPSTIPNPTNPSEQIPNPSIIPWQTRLVNYFLEVFQIAQAW